MPILLYGSEIWGFENPKQLQTMVNNVMRKFLKLHKSTPMCMINGELGFKEISEYIENRMMNFWFQVETGEESKVSTILYKWIKIQHIRNSYSAPWIEKIEATLEHMGMPSLFDVVTNTSKSWFKNNTKIRLNNLYTHK